MDPFARYVPPATASATPVNATAPHSIRIIGSPDSGGVEVTLSKESFDALLLARDQSAAARLASAAAPGPAGESPPILGTPAVTDALAGARDNDANRGQLKPDVSVHPTSNLAPIRSQLDALL
eukprot:2935592-Pleurochrysis_carterae.AAC.1